MSQESDKLFHENMRLVHKIANRYSRYGYACSSQNFDDLFQEGLKGLLHASRNYKENRKTKFSTYAVHCIMGYIKKYINTSCSLIRLPTKVSANRVTREKCAVQVSTIETKDPEDKGLVYYLPAPEDIEKETESKSNFNVLIRGLSIKQKKYLRQRFIKQYSYTEIGENFGISVQAVHSSIKGAIKKIRKNIFKLVDKKPKRA